MMVKFQKSFPILAMLLATVTLLTACPSVPTREFDAYLTQFQTGKTTAEDVILKAKIRAEALADDPSNPKGAAERARDLAERKAAMDARLDALNVVDSYNRVLTDLSSGSSPKDIKNDLESFSDGLSKFNVASIGNLVGSASPYLGVISQAVSLIDGYMLAEQFGKVAAAGEKPVLSILQILVEDADKLVIIEKQWISLKVLDPNRIAANAARKHIQALSSTFSTNADVTAIIVMANDHLKRYQVDDAEKPAIVDINGAASPSASEIDLLRLLVAKLGESIDGYDAGLDQIDAYVVMMTAYKNVLGTTSNSLISLNRAIVTGRRSAAVDLAAAVIQLRESYLALEEAK